MKAPSSGLQGALSGAAIVVALVVLLQQFAVTAMTSVLLSGGVVVGLTLGTGVVQLVRRGRGAEQ